MEAVQWGREGVTTYFLYGNEQLMWLGVGVVADAALFLSSFGGSLAVVSSCIPRG